ncbi:MAG: hypothetical protein ACR2QV_09485 [Gammaproteobacteria bacterium]
MTDHDDDRELDRYLEGGADASRRYAELGDELPPPELDAKILAEAEQAAKVTPLNARRAPPFKAFAWAAIVVLSFSLVLNIVFEQAVQDPVRQLESAAERSNKPARDAAPAAASPAVEADDVLANVKRDMGLQAPAADEREERKEREAAVSGLKRAAEEDRTMSAAAENFMIKQDAPSPAQEQTTARARAGAKASPATPMTVLAEYLAEVDAEGRADGFSGALVDLTAKTADDTDADTDDELRAILELDGQGREDEAAARLIEFRIANPEHPFSVELEERGL